MFLSHFDVIRDKLLYRRTATYGIYLDSKYTYDASMQIKAQEWN